MAAVLPCCVDGVSLLYVVGMDVNAVVGCALIAAALGLLTYLVLWSRRTIDRIAGSDGRSAREIDRELRRGG